MLKQMFDIQLAEISYDYVLYRDMTLFEFTCQIQIDRMNYALDILSMSVDEYDIITNLDRLKIYFTMYHDDVAEIEYNQSFMNDVKIHNRLRVVSQLIGNEFLTTVMEIDVLTISDINDIELFYINK